MHPRSNLQDFVKDKHTDVLGKDRQSDWSSIDFIGYNETQHPNEIDIKMVKSVNVFSCTSQTRIVSWSIVYGKRKCFKARSFFFIASIKHACYFILIHNFGFETHFVNTFLSCSYHLFINYIKKIKFYTYNIFTRFAFLKITACSM